MSILFHPTHRKFIKLLRSYADRGVNVDITKDDYSRYKQIFERSNIAVERHRAIYRLMIEILNRQTSLDKGRSFNHKLVDIIENSLAIAERKSPWNTFKGAFLKPVVLFLLKRLK